MQIIESVPSTSKEYPTSQPQRVLLKETETFNISYCGEDSFADISISSDMIDYQQQTSSILSAISNEGM